MPTNPSNGRKHFFLTNLPDPEPFRSPRTARSNPPPRRDRIPHGTQLLERVDALAPNLEAVTQAQGEAGFPDRAGIQVEFEGFEGVGLAFESLSREKQGIELSNAIR